MPEPTTARARIERAMHVSFKLPAQVAEMLDAYRDQVLTEAAAMLRAHCPQHTGGDTAFMSCHCPAAVELERAARTSPAKPRPVALCELPHPVAPDTWCALPIEHQGWHEDAAGDRWPHSFLPGQPGVAVRR